MCQGVASLPAIYGSLEASGPKAAKKSPQSLPGPSGQESQKSPEKVEKSPKSLRKVSFFRRPFRDFFETEGLGRLFEDFFAVFGLEGLEIAVDGRQGRNQSELSEFVAELTEFAAELILRAKGALIGAPRFSTPATCDFSHAIQGNGDFQGKTLEKGYFPCIAWGKSHVAGGRNRGSLISAPLALRAVSSLP